VATQRLAVPIFGLERDKRGAAAIECALVQVPGVAHATVNAALEMAYVAFDPAVCKPDRVVAAIHRAGFVAGRPHLR
jgi:copper chaperone CopZ